MKGSRKRGSLQQGLDREVFAVVRKWQDDNPDAGLPTTTVIYTWIQSSNSSLKRNNKKTLESSIDRCLDVLYEDTVDTAEDDIGPIEIDLKGETPGAETTNIMNKALRGVLAAANNTSGEAVTYLGTPEQRDIAIKRARDHLREPNGEPAKKKKKSNKEETVDRSPPSNISIRDIGGVDHIKLQLAEHLTLPLLRPEAYSERNLPIPRGILLHGPPGCGKTVISRAFAAELGVPFIEIPGPSIVSGMSGESEQKIREYFDEARRLAPCLVFIDEIDVIAPKRESSQSQMEKRIVAQLLISMDSLATDLNDGKPVIVLAASNRPDSLDPALRRGGRFDTEINMGVPNEKMRESILQALTRHIHVAEDVDFRDLAKKTSGFVGADLRDLVGKAGSWSMTQYRQALERQTIELEENQDEDMMIDGQEDANHTTSESPAFQESPADISILRLIKRAKDKSIPDPPGFEDKSIHMSAFLAVLPDIQPSSKREGFATIPDTTWDHVGALHAIRKDLEMAIVQPIKNPERFKMVGISAPTGVLLWGPPGCGKTLVAKAVANESKANFISVKGPELLNKFVGESERAIRQVFTRARSSVPCVLFFDELDALVPSRYGADGSGSEASARVVNTLLTELDGLSSRDGIYVVAATNRPDVIDQAMLRPGRLETLLYIGLPSPTDRIEILKTLMRATGGAVDDSLAVVAGRDDCMNFSGADLSALLRKAGHRTLERDGSRVEEVDLIGAMGDVVPSVNDLKRYERMRERLSNTGMS